MRSRNILLNASIAIVSLLLFLTFFEERLVLPPLLQITGRLHPMLLHFPIVLLIGYGVLLVLPLKTLREQPIYASLTDGVLLLALFSTSLTALGGLFLSREEGYDRDDLLWHKWGGVALTLFVFIIYVYRRQIAAHSTFRTATAIAAFSGILFTGHQGAIITHGQDFLLAPVFTAEKEPAVSIEEAEVFAHLVQPVLEAKCVSCHNVSKAKGELIMETVEALKKGGKSGKLWDLSDPELGLLIQRIHLPLDAKKHMPPQGKPQLTDEEQTVLYHWVKGGSLFDQRIAALAVTDTLRLLAERIFSSRDVNEYDFTAVSDKTVASLNNSNRVLYPLAEGSPALAVNFYNKEFFSEKALSELLVVKEQLVEMDLSRMPVTDQHMSIIRQFSQLRKLSLNFTSVSGKALPLLQSLSNLQTLSLAGTQIEKKDLVALEKIGSLKRAVIWNTAIPFAELEQLKSKKGGIHYETGFRGDTIVLPLTAPLLQNEETVISGSVPLKLKHYVNGVVIRYTTDGSDPDSARSPVYNDKVTLQGNTLVKARAFKSGWKGSEVVQQYFYKSTYQPDTSFFVTMPDPKYVPFGTRILFDKVKGEIFNFGGGQWLGYRENKMENLLHFKQAKSIQQVLVSCLVAPGSYIMPPVRVEVWGGDDPKNLKLLGKASPAALTKMETASNLPVDIVFPAAQLTYMKVIAVPLPRLPAWHPGKGEKGWVFVDELFIN